VSFDPSLARWLAALALACGLSACVTTAPKTTDSGGAAPTTPAEPTTQRAAAARPAAPSAYQLQDCKAEQGWAIVGGRCDSFGLFQGSGTGVRGALLFTGNFVAGLPHGKGQLCLRGASQDSGRGTAGDCGNALGCRVEFNAGRLSGTEMVCQQSGGRSIAGQRADLRIKLRSPSGFFIDDGAAQQQRSMAYGRVSTITTDQATVEISGQIQFAPLHIADYQTSASAVGELRQVSLSADAVRFDRFSGQLVVPSRQVRGGGGELRAKGVFKGDIHGTRVLFTPYPATVTAARAITRESIVELDVSGRHYQLVYDGQQGVSAQADARQVLYYKDDAGVEFDGTFAGCAERNRPFGFARLQDKREASSGTFLAYELEPFCGKITTPSGSYAGKFRNGRPVN